MTSQHIRRSIALLVSAALLASLTVATVASPASAAKPKCQGFKATIVGTNKADILKGTARRDIIVARGGDDRIYAKGGNDVICAGGGNDVVFGGAGIDRLWGQTGHDTLVGNAGPDFLAGQVGNDTLNGGIGVDTCFQGTGTGPVTRCERPAPPGPTLIPLTGILAVAYCDIDDLDGYSTGDVLIARLMDTDGNGPDAGDIIEMGRYPLDLDASAFGNWTTTSHVVASISSQSTSTTIGLTSTGNAGHTWYRLGLGELYSEDGGIEATFLDGFDGTNPELIAVQAGSPSGPQTPVFVQASGPSTTDDAFIDVILNYQGA